MVVDGRDAAARDLEYAVGVLSADEDAEAGAVDGRAAGIGQLNRPEAKVNRAAEVKIDRARIAQRVGVFDGGTEADFRAAVVVIRRQCIARIDIVRGVDGGHGRNQARFQLLDLGPEAIFAGRVGRPFQGAEELLPEPAGLEHVHLFPSLPGGDRVFALPCKVGKGCVVCASVLRGNRRGK